MDSHNAVSAVDEDKPHRVIYKLGSRISTRIFPNKFLADEFAKTKPIATVELASKPPNIVNASNRSYLRGPHLILCAGVVDKMKR